MKKGGIVAVILILLAVLGLLGSCAGDNDYERAGKEFGTWIKNDPNTWTDTEKKYFNDFMEWSDKQQSK